MANVTLIGGIFNGNSHTTGNDNITTTTLPSPPGKQLVYKHPVSYQYTRRELRISPAEVVYIYVWDGITTKEAMEYILEQINSKNK